MNTKYKVNPHQNSMRAVAYQLGFTIEELAEMLSLYEEYKKTEKCPTCRQSVRISDWVCQKKREVEMDMLNIIGSGIPSVDSTQST